VDVENRQGFAALEAEILDDEIAFLLVRPMGRRRRLRKGGRSGRQQQQGGGSGAEGHRHSPD
jgi:hypothetical protein